MSSSDDTKIPLANSVCTALEDYFDALDGEAPNNLYAMFISEVERPLFEAVMRCARDNQTHAASYLGISRSTLRKKLKQYNLLD